VRPFDPLEKNSFLCISVLVGVKDVATLLENPAGNTRHQAGSVRSVKESNDRESLHLSGVPNVGVIRKNPAALVFEVGSDNLGKARFSPESERLCLRSV
jgi:hypothetical protein